MQRDPVFHRKYSCVVEKYRTEGCSRQTSDEEVPKLNPILQLSHHAIWHSRKPGEPRVVFDCASKSGGTSLNEQSLRRPENTSTLIGVIFQFRIDDVAVMANIKRMFHQVFVVPQDRGEFCYLWWPSGELSRKPKTYQMLVHIFGAKSSRVWLDMPLEKRPKTISGISHQKLSKPYLRTSMQTTYSNRFPPRSMR